MTMTTREPARSNAHDTPRPGTIGLWTCVALVTGNIIGSGVFLLPSSLAPYGGLAIVGWTITALGAVCLALTFARLSRILPRAGGPYAYTRAGYGEFTGFWIAWGYWIALWTGNAAIAVAFGSYLKVFIPVFEGNTLLCALAAIGAVWALAALNAAGIRRAGAFQLVTMLIKLLPLVAMATLGLFWTRRANFEPLIPEGMEPFGAINAVAALTLWAFLGLESATIPADSVRNPERTIPRATVIGTVLCAFVYIASTIAIMGAIPREVLASSQAPFADAARTMWGEAGYYLVGFGAIVSCLGALNGWMLLAGQFPAAAAKDGMFPAVFARMSPRGVPVVGTVIAAVLITIMLSFNYSGAPSLVSVFNFAILLATLCNLMPYAFCSVAEFLIHRRNGTPSTMRRRHHVIAAFAFVYSVWAVYGSGAETVLLGFVLMLAGVPVYLWLQRAR